MYGESSIRPARIVAHVTGSPNSQTPYKVPNTGIKKATVSAETPPKSAIKRKKLRSLRDDFYLSDFRLFVILYFHNVMMQRRGQRVIKN